VGQARGLKGKYRFCGIQISPFDICYGFNLIDRQERKKKQKTNNIRVIRIDPGYGVKSPLDSFG
jgi:hypothetical protein